MSAYIEPIEVAVFMFPFLALLLSLPIFVKQYRQYGRFSLSRGIIIYTFIFYLLPNVLGRGMGQLAKGLNSLNHHIQQMALIMIIVCMFEITLVEQLIEPIVRMYLFFSEQYDCYQSSLWLLEWVF